MSDLREAHDRIHHFMRGWDQGEVISGSVTAEGQAVLRYSDIGALLDAAAPARVEITDEPVPVDSLVLAYVERMAGQSRQGLADNLREFATRIENRTAVPFLQPQPVDRPLLDRVDVRDAIRDEFRWVGEMGETSADVAADAVMELARPMPTRDAIVNVLHENTIGVSDIEGAADALVALLGGVDESGKS